MIRTVPTGDLGLDVLLGGGWRLVTRLPDRESATVLVRGGAGAGKTLVGLDVALGLAKAFDGDVVVGCVEILPSEYVAQLRSARGELAEDRLVTLPGSAASATGPRVFAGLLTEIDPSAPDLVASLEALGRDVVSAGGKPVAFIVDSLIEGYGIGASVSRVSADAVMKFAAQGGYGVVLCEELLGFTPSPWVFAADTVLELGTEAHWRGRWVEVRKHRYGASVGGRHELEIPGWGPVAVFPEPHAWVAHRPHEMLSAHRWKFLQGRGTPPLVWHDALRPQNEDKNEELSDEDEELEILDALRPQNEGKNESKDAPLEGAFGLISSRDAGVARTLAFGLLPAHSQSKRDLIVALDPLARREDGWLGKDLDVHYLPTMWGPARALRVLVEQFAHVFGREGYGPEREGSDPQVRRVLLGDLGLVLAAPDALQWVEAVRIFASLVIESGWGIPVIAYDELYDGGDLPTARSILATHADINIVAQLRRSPQPQTFALATERWRRTASNLVWKGDLAKSVLPEDLAPFDRLPLSHVRMTDWRNTRETTPSSGDWAAVFGDARRYVDVLDKKRESPARGAAASGAAESPVAVVAAAWSMAEAALVAAARRAGMSEELLVPGASNIATALAQQGVLSQATLRALTGLEHLHSLIETAPAPDERMTPARAREFAAMAGVVRYSIEHDVDVFVNRLGRQTTDR